MPLRAGGGARGYKDKDREAWLAKLPPAVQRRIAALRELQEDASSTAPDQFPRKRTYQEQARGGTEKWRGRTLPPGTAVPFQKRPRPRSTSVNEGRPHSPTWQACRPFSLWPQNNNNNRESFCKGSSSRR